MKKINLLLLFILFNFSLFGCTIDRTYQGDYPELVTVAMYSLLNTNGYVRENHGYVSPEVKVLEEDNYGRKMFAYCEDQYGFVVSILIIQYSDDEYAYYYPDYNFISRNAESSNEGRSAMFGYGYDFETSVNVFTIEEKDKLKELNEWNTPIQTSYCIKAKISRLKEDPPLNIKGKEFEEIFRQAAKESGCKGVDLVYRFSVYCTSDDYGRVLFYGFGIHRDVKGEGVSPTSEKMYFDLAIIFNADGSYDLFKCMVVLNDLYSYQEQLKDLKHLNNWNQV